LRRFYASGKNAAPDLYAIAYDAVIRLCHYISHDNLGQGRN